MSLTPETTEWMRELLQQEIEKALLPLRQELDRLDDWANGVFAVLSDLMPILLKAQPDIAAKISAPWRDAAQQYDSLGMAYQAEDFHQTQELFEARKMLYQQLDLLKAWPTHAQG